MVFGLKSTPKPGTLMDAVWKPAEWAFYGDQLAKHGLSLSSCHVFAENPLDCVEEMNEAARNYGIAQYVLNCPPSIQTDWKAFADLCVRLSQRLNPSLWLHNSHKEITARQDGVTLYEKILDTCGDAIGAQLDVGWALYGGEDPMALLQRLGKRLCSVHYKDVDHGYQALASDQIKACLGDGCLDLRAVQAFCDPLPITQIVDQDKSHRDIVDDQARAVSVLRAIGS